MKPQEKLRLYAFAFFLFFISFLNAKETFASARIVSWLVFLLYSDQNIRVECLALRVGSHISGYEKQRCHCESYLHLTQILLQLVLVAISIVLHVLDRLLVQVLEQAL
jgi:hypothetical protein